MQESGQVIREIAFEMAASSVRFGAGVTREVGMDLVDLGVRTGAGRHRPQPGAARTGADGARRARRGRRAGGALRPGARRAHRRVVPRRDPFRRGHTRSTGSWPSAAARSIDTAKAVNLYTTYPPADFLDYVNAPIGKAMPVPGPLKPLIAIPTTAGTGSETTGVSIFDLTEMHAKTGIASRRLKPTLGLLDPDNTRTMPPQVAASSGLDILSHAIESFTAMPYTSRPRPESSGVCVRPTRAPIRSATSGRSRRCASSRSTSSARSRIRPTMTRARRCCWRRRTPAWDSATPACTSRTACRIRCRAR